MSGVPSCACGTPGCACPPGLPADGVAPAARFAHGAIRDRLIEALGRERALDGLSTRDSSDPAIALIDAWAGALHVLAFSTARLAEDVDLAVGLDRGALVELTRLIGYAPRPAIAAAAALSFTVDPNAASDPTIPAGTQVATVPRDKEMPLTFETASAVTAKAAWNTLKPARAVAVPPVTLTTTHLVITGIDVAASLGDGVLARIDAATLLYAHLVDIARMPDPNAPTTTLTVTGGTAVSSAHGPAMGEVIILGMRTSAFGALAPNYQLVKPGTNSAAIGNIVSSHTIAAGSLARLVTLFGADPIAVAIAALSTADWPGLTMPGDGTVDLSSVVKEALPGRSAVFVAGSQVQAGDIAAATDAFRADFGLSGPVTRITVSGVVTIPGQASSFGEMVRATGILIETQRKRLRAIPDPAERVPVAAARDRLAVTGGGDLPVGRLIALVGKDANTGARLVETATIQEVAPSGGNANLTLTAPLTGVFLAEGLTIAGNVVSASHGATPPNQPELLGSSDAAKPAPVYPLSGSPLTYVADKSARGYSAAAEVRVTGRLYQPADRFLDLTDDRAWRPRQRRDGGFEIQFAGRLPTAPNSVTAKYRIGAGSAGNVDAGRVSMVMTPVLGVTGAANLTAGEGGTDAAGPGDMRKAGDTIVLLDRVVSLADFKRYALSFRGVTNALATELRETLKRTVYLTIAGAGGQLPTPSLMSDLSDALSKVTVPGRRPRILGFSPRRAWAQVRFAHDPAYVRTGVATALRAALLASFSATAREFGQSLYASELIAVAQGVTGVLAAVAAVGDGGQWVAQWDAQPVTARPPRIEHGVLALADLVSIDDGSLSLGVMLP